MKTIKRLEDIEQVAIDLLDMRVFDIEDIMNYGYNEEEAKAIQKEIFRR